jgi:hypothetical protein
MMKKATAVLATASVCGLAAAQEQIFFGDADGFGFGAPEVDGGLFRALGGAFFGDYRDPGDPPTTDIWNAFTDQVWTFEYDAAGITEANLHFYGAGYGDFTGPAELYLDGVRIAVYDHPGLFETTHIVDEPIPVAMLDGHSEFELRTPSGDGYIIDYARLDLFRDGSCYADCDGSGDLDFFDFLCFQNAFAAGDPYADCDDSGSLDFFDFLCFQNEFAAGCP